MPVLAVVELDNVAFDLSVPGTTGVTAGLWRALLTCMELWKLKLLKTSSLLILLLHIGYFC